MDADWKSAHQKLLDIAKQRSRLDHEEATWLRVAHRGQNHLRLGYATFRPGQRESIETLLSVGRLLLVAPTGGGKSLTYQLPASVLPAAGATAG